MKVLASDGIAATALARLRQAGLEVGEISGVQGDALVQALRGSSGLIVRGATKVTAAVIEASPDLRVVVRAGSGTDNIDGAAAKAHGIRVLNTPMANAVSVAELVWGMILAHRRRLVEAALSTRAGRWEKSKFLGYEVAGTTLGLVGFGRIAREVARRGRAFAMTIVAHDPLLERWPADFADVEKAELAQVLERADVLSLHVPLASETRHLIDTRGLARMKTNALLVNCARGGVVDEDALLAALEAGRLGGACLDVFAEEPPRNAALVGHPLVLPTPHIGASTREAQERAGDEAASLMIETLRELAVK